MLQVLLRSTKRESCDFLVPMGSLRQTAASRVRLDLHHDGHVAGPIRTPTMQGEHSRQSSRITQHRSLQETTNNRMEHQPFRTFVGRSSASTASASVLAVAVAVNVALIVPTSSCVQHDIACVGVDACTCNAPPPGPQIFHSLQLC